jgi:hypothetical protein
MLFYADGTEIKVGDSVLIEKGRTPGTIVDVVGPNDIANFNVDEAGVIVKSAPFGLVFIPVSIFDAEGIIFVTRGET